MNNDIYLKKIEVLAQLELLEHECELLLERIPTLKKRLWAVETLEDGVAFDNEIDSLNAELFIVEL